MIKKNEIVLPNKLWFKIKHQHEKLKDKSQGLIKPDITYKRSKYLLQTTDFIKKDDEITDYYGYNYKVLKVIPEMHDDQFYCYNAYLKRDEKK